MQGVLLGVGFILAFSAIYSSVGLLLFHTYKNPFFPYFNGIFHSPYMGPISWRDTRWVPQTLQDFLSLPFRLAVRESGRQALNHVYMGMEIPFRTLYPALIAVISPVFILSCLIRKITSQSAPSQTPAPTMRLFFVFSFMFISLLTWCAMFGYYRYYITLEILSPCVLGVFLARYLSQGKLKTYGLALSSLVVIGLSVYSLPLPQWQRMPYFSSYFGISKADFSSYQNALIISPDYPMGYVLPFFPESDQIMGLPESFLGLSPEFYKSYEKPLQNFDKIFVVFSLSPTNLDNDLASLKTTFNLIVDTKNCKLYTTHAGDLSICPAYKP